MFWMQNSCYSPKKSHRTKPSLTCHFSPKGAWIQELLILKPKIVFTCKGNWGNTLESWGSYKKISEEKKIDNLKKTNINTHSITGVSFKATHLL